MTPADDEATPNPANPGPTNPNPANPGPTNPNTANPGPTNPNPANPGLAGPCPAASLADASHPAAPGPAAPAAVEPLAADRGAAAERTRLAWRRTSLAATAVGLLAARPAFAPAAGTAKWLAAGLAMAGWAVLVGLAYRRARGLTTRPPHPAGRIVPVYAAVALAFAGLGGLVVML